MIKRNPLWGKESGGVRSVAIKRNPLRGMLLVCHLLALAALLFLPSAAAAQPQIALLKYGGGGDWYANPTSLPNLIAFCNADQQMGLNPTPATVDVGSAELFNYPFVHMTGHGNVVFSDAEAQNLRNYLIAGGFLHIDDNYGLREFVVPQMNTSTTTCRPRATALCGRAAWCASSRGSATSVTAGRTRMCTTTAKPHARKPCAWAAISCVTSSGSSLNPLCHR